MIPAAVCFDLDDTLYPYARYARAGLENVAVFLADQTGRHLKDELFELYFDENITNGTFDQLVKRYDWLSESLIDELVREFHRSSGPLEPYDETEFILEYLGDNGYHLGLITDGRNGHVKLDRLGITDYFDVIVVTTELGVSKQYREPFDRVLEELSVAPLQSVYIGDDPRVDFEIPNQIGMRTVRLRHGRYADLEPTHPNARPDLEIDSLGQLPGAISIWTGRTRQGGNQH